MLKILYDDSVGVTEELDNISRGPPLNADLSWLQLCDQQASLKVLLGRFSEVLWIINYINSAHLDRQPVSWEMNISWFVVSSGLFNSSLTSDHSNINCTQSFMLFLFICYKNEAH